MGSAIVTGSAQGIGRSIALRLASDGYDIVISDLPVNEGKLHELAGIISQEKERNVAIFVGDVSVEKDVEDLVRLAVDKYGGLDVMVANAGIHYLASITEMDGDAFDKVLTVNVKGTMFCFKHAALQMIKQGRSRGGRIVGAASTASKKGAADMGCYCASKFAVRGLVQSAALELGKYGITVNAYAPGPIDTTFLGSFNEHYSKKKDLKGNEFYDNLVESCPVGRIGTPDDVAALVSFLVREEASFVTGQSILTSGGNLFD